MIVLLQVIYIFTEYSKDKERDLPIIGRDELKIYISKLGAQYFLVLQDLYALPINKITDIDLHAEHPASKNNVCIRVGAVEYLLKYEQADSVRQFLLDNQIVTGQNLLPK